MTKVNPTLAHIFDRLGEDTSFQFTDWLAGKGYHWRQIERGEGGLTVEQALLAYICECPLRWSTAFLDEPDTGEPYGFFPYQKESILSWQQDAIHQDAAEVGKTREITVLLLWGMCTSFGGTIKRPWCLVGAPQQTHLDEIILGIEEHLGVDEGADIGRQSILQHFWLKPKKTPHYMMRFATPSFDGGHAPPGRIYFRPGSHDGEAFRGVHVNAMAMFDEFAKVKNKTIWTEFTRSLKPGCIQRIYSVPDGDNASEFYRLTQQAIPDLPAGEAGMRLFRWAKNLMPAPFWSEVRRQEFIRRYGGEDSPGYQRNVLGLHGQQENPIWPWETLEPNIQHIDEYRYVKIGINRQTGQTSLDVLRFELILAKDGRKSTQAHTLAERSLAGTDLNGNEALKLLRDYVDAPKNGVFWGGADLGFSNDPTELFIFEQRGDILRLHLRVQLKNVTYDQQAELINAIDRLFSRQVLWGVDFGSAGTAVVQMLHNLEIYSSCGFDARLIGFNFQSTVDCIDEMGEQLYEADKQGNEKAVQLNAKEWSTVLMTQRFQRTGYSLPFDTELVDHLSNHTAKEGAKQRIFSKKNDHTIDAMRTAMLRKVFNDSLGAVDIFASGAFMRQKG